MRLNDVLTISKLSLISTTINISIIYATIISECPGEKDVPKIRRQADQTELSVILYYVSWCHESRTAKRVYDEVAQQHSDQANFAAVNCWHMECNCSYTFPSTLGNKRGYPHKWPTLLVHYSRRMHVQYHDEWKFAAMSRFLENLYQPLERLKSKEDLKILTMRSNAVMLGLFQNASVNEYKKFSFAAVKWLENDPEKIIRFVVGIGKVAEDAVRSLGVTMPLIALLSENQINVFNSTVKWKVHDLVLWLGTEVQRLRKDFYGFTTPSLLVEHVRREAALTIFVNEANNLNENFYSYMTNVMKSFGFVPASKSNVHNCKIIWDDSNLEKSEHHYAIQLKEEFDNVYNNKENSCKRKPKMNFPFTPYDKLRKQYSKRFLLQYQPSAQWQSKDMLSSENLLQLFQHNDCLRITSSEGTPELQNVIAKLFSKFITKIRVNSNANRKNRTLSVHIMDANKYRGLMRELLLTNFEHISTSTTTAIIEPSEEGVYLMGKAFTYESLINFIQDYYNNNLHIKRRSDIGLSLRQAFDLSFKSLSRNSFLDNFKRFSQNKTTVLLIYSSRCAISWLMSHTLMQVSVLLKNSQNNLINIVRLNTQTNDLPWEFVMNKVPALIIVPRGRPDESRLFPTNFEINVRNVLGFILAQLQPLEQVHVALESCNLSAKTLLTCLQFVKKLNIKHISENLRKWTFLENDREHILQKLKIFKDITLTMEAGFSVS